jgi:hypothetical protein
MPLRSEGAPDFFRKFNSLCQPRNRGIAVLKRPIARGLRGETIDFHSADTTRPSRGCCALRFITRVGSLSTKYERRCGKRLSLCAFDRTRIDFGERCVRGGANRITKAQRSLAAHKRRDPRGARIRHLGGNRKRACGFCVGFCVCIDRRKRSRSNKERARHLGFEIPRTRNLKGGVD